MKLLGDGSKLMLPTVKLGQCMLFAAFHGADGHASTVTV